MDRRTALEVASVLFLLNFDANEDEKDDETAVSGLTKVSDDDDNGVGDDDEDDGDGDGDGDDNGDNVDTVGAPCLIFVRLFAPTPAPACALTPIPLEQP